jgi:hypothetical protein
MLTIAIWSRDRLIRVQTAIPSNKVKLIHVCGGFELRESLQAEWLFNLANSSKHGG